MNCMHVSNGFGFLDGNAIIKMNNLAVGYFPPEGPEIGVYPPPSVPCYPADEQLPLTAEQQGREPHLETRS